MNPIATSLACIIGLVSFYTFIAATVKIKWTPIEAACVDCTANQKFSYNHLSPLGKRYYLRGFQSSFLFYWNNEEVTGKQRSPFNLTKYTPGQMYTIKVNPRNPKVIATRGEIAGNIFATVLSAALSIAIILAECNVI